MFTNKKYCSISKVIIAKIGKIKSVQGVYDVCAVVVYDVVVVDVVNGGM